MTSRWPRLLRNLLILFVEPIAAKHSYLECLLARHELEGIHLMATRKSTERSIYREQQKKRTRESLNLSERFQELKTLVVELVYFNPDYTTGNGPIKFTVNPAHAKSVLRFDCSNQECVRGDFDISEALAQAITSRQSSAEGKICCRGWLNKNVIDRVQCGNILCYKLRLGY